MLQKHYKYISILFLRADSLDETGAVGHLMQTRVNVWGQVVGKNTGESFQ